MLNKVMVVKTKYNWDKIQRDYDDGLSQRDLKKKYGVHYRSIYLAVQRGELVMRTLTSACSLARDQGKGKFNHTEEFKKSVSLRQTLHNSGGRCKWFEVDGQKVQGSWERDFAEKLTKLGIEWRKCAGKKDVVWYTLDGKQKAYTPDFYLPAIDVYFELKGYWWGRDKEKMDAVFTQHPNIKIAVILKKEFEYIMSLAVTASGWSRES